MLVDNKMRLKKLRTAGFSKFNVFGKKMKSSRLEHRMPPLQPVSPDQNSESTQPLREVVTCQNVSGNYSSSQANRRDPGNCDSCNE